MHIGLDFETSGLDHRRHYPLTLGIAFKTTPNYVSERSYIPAGKEFRFLEAYPTIKQAGAFDSRAMEVNKIDLNSGSTNWDMPIRETYNNWDYAILIYLQNLAEVTGDPELIPTGFNVGQFDMRFMWHFFPQSASFLSHRPHELNTQIRDCARLTETDKNIVKDAAKAYATGIVSTEGVARYLGPHNALYDACEALYAMDYLDSIVTNYALRQPDEEE